MFTRKEAAKPAGDSDLVLRCSFCNKPQANVKQLIAGPEVFICNECVQVCNEILEDDARALAVQGVKERRSQYHDVQEGSLSVHDPALPVSGPAVRCALCRLPFAGKDGLLIPDRGVLCPGCIDAIEATLASTGEDS